MNIQRIAALGFAALAAGALSSCGSDASPTNTSAQSYSNRPPPPPSLPDANEYRLSDENLSIVYTPAAPAGHPVLTYRDELGTWSFLRSDVEIAATSVGTFVSVQRPIHGASAGLGILIPRAQIGPLGVEAVQTYIITTSRRDHAEGDKTALRNRYLTGQLDQLGALQISGVASHVENTIRPED
jgi:hypothetical protein